MLFCFSVLTELLTSFQTRHDMPFSIAGRRTRKLYLQNLDFRCSRSNQKSRTVSFTCPSFDVSSFSVPFTTKPPSPSGKSSPELVLTIGLFLLYLYYGHVADIHKVC